MSLSGVAISDPNCFNQLALCRSSAAQPRAREPSCCPSTRTPRALRAQLWPRHPRGPGTPGHSTPRLCAGMAIADGMVLGGRQAGSGMVSGWRWDGVAMALGWRWDGIGMLLGWRWDGAGMALGRRWDGAGTALGRRWDGTGTALQWRWDGCGAEHGSPGQGEDKDLNKRGDEELRWAEGGFNELGIPHIISCRSLRLLLSPLIPFHGQNHSSSPAGPGAHPGPAPPPQGTAGPWGGGCAQPAAAPSRLPGSGWAAASPVPGSSSAPPDGASGRSSVPGRLRGLGTELPGAALAAGLAGMDPRVPDGDSAALSRAGSLAAGQGGRTDTHTVEGRTPTRWKDRRPRGGRMDTHVAVPRRRRRMLVDQCRTPPPRGRGGGAGGGRPKAAGDPRSPSPPLAGSPGSGAGSQCSPAPVPFLTPRLCGCWAGWPRSPVGSGGVGGPGRPALARGSGRK